MHTYTDATFATNHSEIHNGQIGELRLTLRKARNASREDYMYVSPEKQDAPCKERDVMLPYSCNKTNDVRREAGNEIYLVRNET